MNFLACVIFGFRLLKIPTFACPPSDLPAWVQGQAGGSGRGKNDEVERVNMREELEILSTHRLAPCHNPIAWIAGQIDESAKPAGLQINAVTEIEGWAPIWSSAASSNRFLKTSATRIEMEADFNAVARFLKELETANPYISMSHVTLLQRKQSTDKYLVNLVMEWPQWCE